MATTMTIGAETRPGNKSYPILVAFRYINISNFFENMEALLLAIWVVGNLSFLLALSL